MSEMRWVGEKDTHPFVSSASLPRLGLDPTLPFSKLPSLFLALGSLPEKERLREVSLFLLAPFLEVTRSIFLCVALVETLSL